jgi:hypothetical protein
MYGSKNVILQPIRKGHRGKGCICYRWLLNVEQDRQYTYNVHCFSDATIIAAEKQWLLHSLCVFVALGVQHAMCMRYIVVCGLSWFTVFFHVIP